MTKSLTELAAKIAAAKASQSSMTPEKIADTLSNVFDTLKSIHVQELSTRDPNLKTLQTDRVLDNLRKNPELSIKLDSITCLECGRKFKLLTKRHLKTHNLTPGEYRARWGFSSKFPLSTKNLSKERSKVARKYNLARNLKPRSKKSGRILSSLELYREAPFSSIQQDKIVCLECGSEFKMLTKRHLINHDLTPRQYKEKWGFPKDFSLLSKSLSEQRKNNRIGKTLKKTEEKQLPPEIIEEAAPKKFIPKVILRKRAEPAK